MIWDTVLALIAVAIVVIVFWQLPDDDLDEAPTTTPEDPPAEEPKSDAPAEEPKAPVEEPKADAPVEEPKADAPVEEPKAD